MQEIPPPNKFTAEMPKIPGVSDSSAKSRISLGKPLFLSIALVGILLLVGGIVRWAAHSMGRGAERPAELTSTSSSEPVNLPPASLPQTGPVTAATLNELAKPWSSKEFTFVDPVTGSTVPAIVIHLPGGAASSSSSYWAFSLEAPLQTCQLVYVTDLSELTSRFNFHAAHPMVASSCDSTLYDPLQMGTISSGAWVRGAIVQGAGIRPPTSIEVEVHGGNLVADRIE
jgi:hypothetical protein